MTKANMGCVGTLILGALFFASTCYIDHRRESKRDRQRVIAEVAKQEQTASALALAMRHGALSDWMSSLPARGFNGPFAIDLSRSIVTTNGVLCEMELRDIVETTQSLVAVFSCDLFKRRILLDLDLFLSCNHAQVQSLLDAATNGRPRFAVIARVSEISRPGFTAGVSGYGDDASVEIEPHSGRFYGKGALVDFLPLKEK
jgi:hypothetical protein